jgi:hypothetical protein
MSGVCDEEEVATTPAIPNDGSSSSSSSNPTTTSSSTTNKLRTLKLTAAAIRMRNKRAKMTESEKTVMLNKNAQYKRKIRSCCSSIPTAFSNKTTTTDEDRAADATRKRLKHSKLTDEEKALVYIKNQEYRKRISVEMKLIGSHYAYRDYERLRKRNREIQKLNDKEKSRQESLNLSVLQKATNAEAEIQKKKAEYDAMPKEQKDYIQASHGIQKEAKEN